MDLIYFLRSRTGFIRTFYSEAVLPFTERKRKIESGEEPFEPPYSEDGDLPYELEWMEADEAIDVLGQMCISMLSSSFELYLREWVDDLHARYGTEQLAKHGIGRPGNAQGNFPKGWINAYRDFFREHLHIDWESARVDLGCLEEIVLARNRIEHPERITSFAISQSKQDAKKYPRSFFAHEWESTLVGGAEDRAHPRPCRLSITGEKLVAALDEVDRFCGWLEEHRLRWPGQREDS